MPSTEHFLGIRPETLVLCGRDRRRPDAFASCVHRGARCEQAVGMAATPDPRMLAVVAEHRWGVLATIKRDGRPQLSNVGYAWDDGLIRVSVTADRAKPGNLRRDPRVGLHVSSRDFWAWVAVEGTAELTAVAADPHDATVEALISYYRGSRG